MDLNIRSWRDLMLPLVGDYEAGRSSRSIEDVFHSNPPKKLNNDVYEIHRPESQPMLEVVFFHGWELGDSQESYWRNWLCDEPHGTSEVHCWLKSWFSKDWPDARVLSVSYDSTLKRTATTGRMDLYTIAENLKISLIDDVKVGQNRCPVILVGHSLGGLVMEALCINANQSKNQNLIKFLRNLKGLFFYATPHSGSILGMKSIKSLSGPLMEDLSILNAKSARLSHDFSRLLDDYHHRSMQVWGIAESHATRLGKFCDLVVPEASARFPKYNEFYTAGCDHFSICRPLSENDVTYKMLKNFVSRINAEAVVRKNSRPDLQDSTVYVTENPAGSDGAEFKLELDAFLAGLESPDSQAKSAEKLIYLSGLNDWTRHLFVSSEGALEKLSCAMANIDDPYVQIKSATVISNLAMGGEDTVMKIVSVKGVLDALVAGLENHRSPELQGLISGIFLSLAKHNEEAKYKIVSTTGALEKLSCAMAENDNYDIQLQSAKSIAYLAMGGERITKKIVDSARVLNALHAGAGSKDIHSQELQQICIEALRYLRDIRMRLGK